MIALLTVVWTAAIAIVIGSLVYATSRWILRRDGQSNLLGSIFLTYIAVKWIAVILGGLFFIVLFGLAFIAFLTNR